MEILLVKTNNRNEKKQDKLFFHPRLSAELFQKYQQLIKISISKDSKSHTCRENFLQP